ncbi:hypothetical protein C8R45DRAFT_992683, partial [Mycena sanguinolenta]
MQIISSLVALITLAPAGMAAATVKPVALSPDNIDAAGLITINDFQGFQLNLVDNTAVGPGEGTAVFAFPGAFSSSLNQEWTFIPDAKNTSNFRIANGLNSSLFLSYPAAAFGGNPAGAELVVSSKFPATFTLQPIGSGTIRILESTTGNLALTSWKALPSGPQGTPAILVTSDPSIQAEQTWTLLAAPV